LNNFIVTVFNERHKASVQEAVNEIRIMTKKYIFGLCLQVIIVSVLTSIVLTILGVKYAILLGVLTGLLNVIPYLGIFISLLFLVLLHLPLLLLQHVFMLLSDIPFML
jgi:predicted PurR-regulated permease PerM